MEKNYKISQVADMFNVSRTALIHYDKCGLLVPSIRNTKKYRLYTAKDIKKLELIIALKESGLTLKEIQDYLAGERTKSAIEILIDQQAQMDQKIENLKKQRDTLNKRIQHLKTFQSLKLYDGIQLNHYPSLSIIREEIGYGPLMSYESAKKRLQDKLDLAESLTSKFAIGFTWQTKDRLCLDMAYLYSYQAVDKNHQYAETTPAGDYLQCIHYGSYETATETVQKILDYAHHHKLTLKGSGYFIPLFDYWELSNEEEFVNEILIPLI